METIRAWKVSDAEDLAAALNNTKIQNNLRDGLPFPYTVKDAEDFISLMQSADPNKEFAFAIVAEDKVVGSMGASRQNNVHYRSAEVGYYISEQHWGKGLATKAVKEICQFIFTNTDIIRLYAEPFSHNIASCKVLEKAGFIREGTLAKYAEKNGSLIDMEMYALIKDNI